MLESARTEGLRFVKYGFVGLITTLTHAALYVGGVELIAVSPQIANLGAFSGSVLLSYFGHLNWTYRDLSHDRSRSILELFFRFLVSAVAGVFSNALIIFIIVDLVDISYLWALPFIVFVTPVLLFFVQRLWVFRA
jgi:putative flippase GtrA